MTLLVELTQEQEQQLRAKAAEAGKEPAAYLLMLADLADGNSEPADGDAPSAYDLFENLLGAWGSGGGANLSEDTGAKFAMGMSEKQHQNQL